MHKYPSNSRNQIVIGNVRLEESNVTYKSNLTFISTHVTIPAIRVIAGVVYCTKNAGFTYNLPEQQQIKMDNFFIIEFDDGLAIVPYNWLSEKHTTCFYPRSKSYKTIRDAVVQMIIPDLKDPNMVWAIFDVKRVFGSAKTFERALEKLDMAKSVSDVNTENEEEIKQTRHERAKRKYSSSDDSNDVPGPSHSKKMPMFPDPGMFSGSQDFLDHKTKPKVLATFDFPVIQDEDIAVPSEISNNGQKKGAPKIIETETFPSTPRNEDQRKDIMPEKKVTLNTDVQTEMMRKMNRILVEVVHTNRKLEVLENQLSGKIPEVQKTDTFEKTFSFVQISSMEDFENFDSSLADDGVFEKMKLFLQLKGGNNVQDVIKNIFKALVHDKVLSNYSLKGAREKQEFLTLKTVDLITVVVRSRTNLKNTTDDEITRIISSWLIQAPTRLRRSIDKTINKNAEENTENHASQVAEKENYKKSSRIENNNAEENDKSHASLIIVEGKKNNKEISETENKKAESNYKTSRKGKKNKK